MSTFLVAYNIRFLYFFTDQTLFGLGYSKTEKFIITWLLKSVLITTYAFCEFFAKTYIGRVDFQKVLLKTWLILSALDAAWKPVCQDNPNIYLALNFLETFIFTIGPLVNSTSEFLEAQPDGPYSTWIIVDNVFSIFLIIIHRWFLPTMYHLRLVKCITPIITLVTIFYREIVEEQKEFGERIVIVEEVN